MKHTTVYTKERNQIKGLNEGNVQTTHFETTPLQWRTQEFFFGGGVQQIQWRTEDREEGDLGAVTP